MPGLPIWYELMTPDPGAVAPFYRAVLGWEIPAEGHPMPNGSEYREIRRGDGGFAGGVLTLTAQMAGSGVQPSWQTYFEVDDVDAAVATASGLGASVHMPPMTMDGVGRMAMIADPQGASLYLMDPTPPPGDPDAQSDAFDARKAGHGRWNELMTTDEPGATAFYSALFAWNSDQTMETPGSGTYRMVEVGGVPIGAISSMIPPDWPPAWMPYFGVPDIGAAKAAIEREGGSVFLGPQPVPGDEHILIARDPAGATVGFVGPKGA
jgi:hypothetical protein